MLKVIRHSNNRLDIVLTGKLDANEVKIALDELESKAQGIENGQMLYEVIDFQLPTAGAIGVEFSRLPAMPGLVKKFSRAAVLTDKTWLKKVSEFKGMFYPGLEIKAFDRNQKAQAEAWLSG